MSVEIRPEDFADWDWENVELTGCQLLGEVSDMAFHFTNPGEGWEPFAEPGDVPALIAEVRGHLERLEAATKKARKELADVERNARLAARRRKRAQQKTEENS